MFSLREIAAKIVVMLQNAFKIEALSQTQTEWFSCFKWDEMALEDHLRSGLPQLGTTKLLKKFTMIYKDHCQTKISELICITGVLAN